MGRQVKIQRLGKCGVKVLITEATGFIGRALCTRLVSDHICISRGQGERGLTFDCFYRKCTNDSYRVDTHGLTSVVLCQFLIDWGRE